MRHAPDLPGLAMAVVLGVGHSALLSSLYKLLSVCHMTCHI
jgi:hypothetical protein